MPGVNYQLHQGKTILKKKDSSLYDFASMIVSEIAGVLGDSGDAEKATEIKPKGDMENEKQEER